MVSLIHRARPWLEAALGLVYPETCQLCRCQRAGRAAGYVCPACAAQARFVQPPFCARCGLPYAGDLTASFECGNCHDADYHFRFARASVISQTTVREAIHRFKYSGALWFEPFLAGLLIQATVPGLHPADWDCIVPVPLHPVKRRERGFNQAELLGHCLAQATRIPLRPGILKRVLPTKTQTALSRRDRAVNMRGAFAVPRGTRLKRQRIILLDDVFTTGATTNACARELRRAGAADVCVWTVARGI